jgi:amidohydrolase
MTRSPGAETPPLRDAVAEILPGVIADRRHLHQHPELAFHEEQTARFVAERLRALGAEDIQTGIATTGVTALIRGTGGAGPGRTVLLRADMDALPIQEENAVEYRSVHPGVMHACGHDGHTAILLAVARLLRERRHRFTGTVKLCFQPAEEAPPGGGALPMIDAGVLDDPPVDAAFGLHLAQWLPVGVVGVRPGPAMATGTYFHIVIRGRGGHASTPERTVDPIVVAAQVVVALQTLVARETDPFAATVVTVSTFHAGEGIAVIPDRAEIRGVVKAFSEEGRDALVARVEALARGIAGAMRAEVDIVVEPGYPVTRNDAALTELVRAAAVETVDADRVVDGPMMGSEDMGHFLQRVPGCYFFVGTRNEATGVVWDHHHPRFDIDEAALAVGVEAMTRTTLRYLAREATPEVAGP